VIVGLISAVVGSGLYWLAHRSMVDDAFITLDYARQLGLHGRWGMVDGLIANSATSPLSVLLLGGISAILRDEVLAVGVLLVSCFTVAGIWMHRIGGPVATALGVGLLATSPLLVSTIGLESYLAITLMIGLVRFARTEAWWMVGALAGLLILARPDLAVISVIAVAAAVRFWWRVLTMVLLVTMPWFTWSWFALGSAIPDTFLMKAGSGGWGGWPFVEWFMLYLPIFPAAVILSLVPAAVGLLCLPLWWREPIGWIWGGGALAHYLTMEVLNAGLYHWYAAPSVAGLGLIAVVTVAQLRRSLRWPAVGCAAGFLAVCAFSILDDGIPRARTPIGSNWASADQYRAIAAALPHGATVLSPGEIGTLAYYCDCRVVDGFADRGYFTDLLAHRRAEATGLKRTLLDLNYAHFKPVAPQPLTWRMTTPADHISTNPPMRGSWGDGRSVHIEPVVG
jgi:hypothetical protein